MPNYKQSHPAYRGPWQTIRKQILQRDNHTCQIRGPRCTTTATHVDHIIPITAGGPWWDHDNLRAACSTCNYQRIDRKQTEAWRTANTHITLIIGPPGINKTSAFNPQPGDLIIDYDNIQDALGVQPHPDLHGPALKARGAILGELKAGRTKSKRCFIISSNPRAETFFPYHKVKIVDPGIDNALEEVERGFNRGDHLRGSDDSGNNVERMKRLVREWYGERSGDTRKGQSNSRNW